MSEFDKVRCARRRDLMILKEKEAVTFSVQPGVFSPVTPPPGMELLGSYGEIPTEPDVILEKVRALQPPSASPLEMEQIAIHCCVAANGTYIPSHQMFMDSATLVNIARGGEEGIAFMNSHRTGSYSTPAELPYGRTFAGRYEQWIREDGEIFEQAIEAVYMLRGVKPSGDNGPTIDDIDAMISGGVIKDVSVGLTPGNAGWIECDICHKDYYNGGCRHYRGSTYNMEEDEIQRQKNRGISGGFCTVTLRSWEQSEVSAVYDGAVPGAGFSKIRKAISTGTLTGIHLQEIQSIFTDSKILGI